MLQHPHYGTLCKQSKAGVGLVVALVPLEFLIAGVGLCQIVLARSLKGAVDGGRKKSGSPTPS
jgi:hypothetical protein